MRWSQKYEECISCNSIDRPHVGHGLCSVCYNCKMNRNSPGSYTRIIHKYDVKKELTREVLEKLYFDDKLHIKEIAFKYNISYDIISRHMKKMGIQTKRGPRPGRTDGNIIYNINPAFFSKWTAEMAWVLGFFVADGNLSKGRNYIRFSQKTPEILEKIRNTMQSSHPIKEVEGGYGNKAYVLGISNSLITHDLIKLGMTSNKSRTIKFPYVPDDYIRHFIRGCWDGDGCVILNSCESKVTAQYCSGSLEFMKGMREALSKEDIINRDKAITPHKSNCFYLTVSKMAKVVDLYHYFYDDVSEDYYLKRKHDIFLLAPILHKCSKARREDILPLLNIIEKFDI